MKQDNSFYPKIFFPYAYKNILESKPSIPDLPVKPSKPQEPTKIDDNPREENGCMSSTIAFILLAFGIVAFLVALEQKNGGQLILCSLFFIGLGAFSLHFNYKLKSDYENELPKLKKKYNDDLIKFKQDTKEFEQEFENYTLKLSRYEEDLIKITSTDYVFLHRSAEINKYFSTQIFPINKSASSFYIRHKTFIENYFLKHFKNNYRIYLLENAIAIIDNNGQNIAIDVKIDIPYDSETGNILSFTNDFSICTSSDKRLVFIFAEEQTILQPKECIEFIEYSIVTLKQLLPINKNFTRLKLVKVWTKDAATNMAFKRFRNTYANNSNITEYNLQRNFFNHFKDIDDNIDDLPF